MSAKDAVTEIVQANTVSNIIYSIFNVEFREAFKRVLSYGKCFPCKGYEFGKPIRSNGTSTIAEYGALTTRRTSSASRLVNERITCV